MVSEQFDSGDNMLPLEADRVHVLKQMQQNVREPILPVLSEIISSV